MQGDICSPYGYIIALAYLFLQHDPDNAPGTGVMMAGGLTIPALTYADDSALICSDTEEASRRVTNIRLGFRTDGDKEVSQPKTEVMKIQSRLHVTKSTEEEYSEHLSLKCEYCGSKGGRKGGSKGALFFLKKICMQDHDHARTVAVILKLPTL